VTGWRRAAADWTVVGGSTLFCHALGAVTSLLLRMFLSPAQMGIWQAIKMFLAHGNYANFGISKGAIREYTIERGARAREAEMEGTTAGESEAAQRWLRLAFSFNTVTSLAYALLMLGVAGWILFGSSDIWSTAWAAGFAIVGLLAVLSRYVTFHVTILRARQAFTVTSKLAILEAVLTLVVACGLTYRFGLTGLYFGTLIVMLGAGLFVVTHRGASLGWTWDWPEMRRLIGIGAPILMAGATMTLLRSLDKLAILVWFPDREHQLGCYSLALMAATQLFGLGTMFSMVMSPRYGEKLGHSRDPNAVARLASRTMEIQAAAITLPAVWTLVAAAPLLGWLLPRYASGLPSLVLLMPGVICLTIALPAQEYLVAINRQKHALGIVVLTTILAAVGNGVALYYGYGLAGVAVATSLGYAVYMLLITSTSIWTAVDRRTRRRSLGLILLVTVLPVGLAWYWATSPITLTTSDWHTWGAVGLRTLLVTLAWALCAAIAWRWRGR
jgi:O-antigen/teichoic acid export membrane protein